MADSNPPAQHALTGPASHAGDTLPSQAAVGLRFGHHDWVREHRPPLSWLEIHPENYLTDRDARALLHTLRADYALSFHAVGLSPGSADGVDAAHLRALRQLIDELDPALVSDHLAWNTTRGRFLPDLLPLPYTEESLAVVTRNVECIQENLQRRVLLENPSLYLNYHYSPLPEEDFLAEVVARTGCGVLLDVNNIYVSASNQGRDPMQTLNRLLDRIPAAAIGEIHLAGHQRRALDAGRCILIDDHGSAVSAAVWALYRAALQQLGRRPTLVEWDTALPAFATLAAEAARAQAELDALPDNGLASPPPSAHRAPASATRIAAP